MKPRLLDLFCGAGGAGMGYARAGFDVVGVDVAPQPRYPFEFVESDWEGALAVLPGLWEREGVPYVIHASPPCQQYSAIRRGLWKGRAHPDLIAPVREALEAIGAPYVIENVEGAPLRNPIRLCGSSFGLPVRRHRRFEIWPDAPLLVPPCQHDGPALQVNGHTGGSSRRDPRARFGGLAEWRAGMDMPWASAAELAEAIPPAYTEWIGGQLRETMAADAAA